MLYRKEISSAEEQLREYTILNQHVLESMVDWVRLVRYDGTILYANKSMKVDIGYDPVGKKCHESVGKEKPCTFCTSKRSIIENEIVKKEELINNRYFSVISSPVINEDGNVLGAVEVLRDITRERKLEIELINQNAKMLKDIKFAEKIQRGILPEKGVYKTLKIDHRYKPAEILSGDLYDIFYVDKDNIGIYICDVAGHGTTASMITMFVRQTMRAIKDDILSPSKVLTKLQSNFGSLNLGADKYFTIFYAIFNVKENRFKYANAGHNCIPIKYNSKDKSDIDMLKIKGLPISKIFDELFYEENEIILDIKDKVLFYTDGIKEVRNIKGEEFGTHGIVDIIKNNNEGNLDMIIESVEEFAWGQQKDDYAILLMEVLDK